MSSQSNFKIDFTPDERRDFGFIRVRDIAFDAVQSLWKRRQSEGMTQADLAAAINADAGWVSKNLRGPGNWTLRTVGTFVEGLRGEAQIMVRAAEDPLPRTNWHAYADFDAPLMTATVGAPPSKPVAIEQTTATPKAPSPKAFLATTLTP